jgi:hypothetical protein
MFDEAQILDTSMIDETVIDFDFIGQFVLETPDDIVWTAQDYNPMPNIDDVHVVGFNPTDEVYNAYRKS